MWLWILLGVLAVLVIALFGAAWYFFKLSIVREEREKTEADFVAEDSLWKDHREVVDQAQKWMAENAEEHVQITSHDGLKLSAIYIPAGVDKPGICKPRGTCIVFHGYRSLATVDFAPEAEFLHSLGYRLLAPYQRSHGESEGKYITYGVKERFDCRDWARYIDARFPGEDIFLMGISMGSATVMMSSDLDLPRTVRGIVADCGFTTPWEIMAHVAKKDYKLPAFPLLHLVDLIARRRAGYALKGADSRKALAKTSLPVLFIHGEADDFVPLYMTKENYEACHTLSKQGDKELYTVPGAGHALSFCVDPHGCEEKIAAFLSKNGSGSET